MYACRLLTVSYDKITIGLSCFYEGDPSISLVERLPHAREFRFYDLLHTSARTVLEDNLEKHQITIKGLELELLNELRGVSY